MIIEISVAFIAAAFVALVIFLILALRSLRITFDSINATLRPIQRHTEELCNQTECLIEQTTALTNDVNNKLEALDGVFNSLSHVGNHLENLTKNFDSQLKERPLAPEPEEHPSVPVEEMFEWVLLGCQIWQKFKKRR